jgi:hypothetical protein
MFLQTPKIWTTKTRLTATKDLTPRFSFLITFLDRFPLIVKLLTPRYRELKLGKAAFKHDGQRHQR